VADGFTEQVRAVLARQGRSGELADMFGRQPANAEVQKQGGGLGIEHIRRGVAKAVVGGLGAEITVSATAFAPLTTPLSLEMWLSGRPLEVMVSGLWSVGTNGVLVLDILLRGVSMADAAVNGVAYSSVGGVLQFKGYALAMNPPPGRATIEVLAMRATANGTIYAGADNAVTLTAKEL
jgi:hypothetical protein